MDDLPLWVLDELVPQPCGCPVTGRGADSGVVSFRWCDSWRGLRGKKV